MSLIPPEQRIFTELTDDDETLEVWLDGEVVQTVSYDAVGSAGMRAICELVEKIASSL